MTYQLVPSYTIVAKVPATALQMSVCAAPPVWPITLLEAETILWFAWFWKVIARPMYSEPDGKVTTQSVPDLLLITQFSVSAKVKSAVFTTGAVDA